MKTRWLGCLPLVLLALTAGMSQPQVKDSLASLLKSRLDDKTRVDVLNALSYQFYDNNDSLAGAYAEEALSKGLAIKYLNGVKYAYTLVGLGYTSKSDYKRAIEYYRLSQSVPAEDSSLEIYNWVLWGNSYRDMASFDSAFVMYQKARVMADDHEKDLANIYKNIGLVHVLLWHNKVALNYLDSASRQLKKFPNPYTQLDVWSLYGLTNRNLLRYEKSGLYYDSMCMGALQVGDYYHQIKCLINRTELAYSRADFSEALKFCFDALELTRKYSYPPQYVKLLQRIGEVYNELSQFEVASQYFYQALSMAQRFGFKLEEGQILSELAWIKKENNDYRTALEYIQQSEDVRQKIGDVNGLGNCHSVRGLVYFLMREYNHAIQEFDLAVELRTQIGNAEGVSAALFNKSLVYEAMGDTRRALDLQLLSIGMGEKTQNKLSIAIAYNAISLLYIKMGNLSEALGYMIKARKIGQETNSRMLQLGNLECFVKYYEALGNWREAHRYQKMYQVMSDSIYSDASMVKLAEMEALYNLDKKEREIELLGRQKQIQQNQIDLQRSQLLQKNIIIFSVITSLLLAGVAGYFGYRSYRTKTEDNKELIRLNREIQEQKEEMEAQSEELMEANQAIAESNRNLEQRVEVRTTELKQAYKELDTFFYRSSHDFRRPLTTFLGLSEVAKITVRDENALELFGKVSDTAHNLDKMLMKLQSISDLGTQQLVYKEVFIRELLNEMIVGYRKEIDSHAIHTFLEVNMQQPFYSYPAMVKIIAENIFENAIYFCRTAEPYIKVKVLQENGQVKMIITDNGQGIQPEYQDRIFEMYFRANQNSKGNGLGLYIAKKAVEKLRGVISFTSTFDAGTTFTVELPMRDPDWS